jgi:hypothetical protein
LTPAGGGKLIRVRHFRVACAALAVAASGVAPFACSSPPALLGAGSQCFQTTDCQEGLFCVQQPGGKASMCSTDLASTVSTEEAGSEDAAMQVSADGGDATSTAEGGSSDGAKAPSPADGASPDVGTQPTPDTGAPPKDAQSPPKEAAPPEAAPPDVAQGSSSGGGDSSVQDSSSE